jgi:hypothetical protein
MAAGGSAPEFFTSLMGVTVTKNDIGFGTIVGSAVFNVLFVIGVCGVFAPEPLKLTWWPLFRDCTYYIICLIILAVFISDNCVSIVEAGALFLLYIGYVTVMRFNQPIQSVFAKLFGMPMVGADDDDNSESSKGSGDGVNPNVFQRSTKAIQPVLAADDPTGPSEPPPAARRRRRSTTSILVEVRRAKTEGGRLSASIVADLENMSDSFRHHNEVAAKHDAKNQKALHEGASSEKGALSKFKAGAQIVIENDRLLRHAEDVLQRPETRVRPT